MGSEMCIRDRPSKVEFIEALPRNATGKVLKRTLREDYIGSDAPAIS